MKYIKKYPKASVIILISVILIGVLLYRERSKVLSSTTEMKLSNEPRLEEVFTDDFYTKQLTQKELKALEVMEERLQSMEGGLLEFEEALTGTEYMRIITALENENDYFYGFFEIPMSDENIYLKHKNKDFTSIKDEKIVKTLLFLSSAEGINIVGQYADDGTVENLKEVEKALGINNEEKLVKVEQKKQDINQIIQEVLTNIPSDAGQKDTLTYFYDWIHENIEFNNRLGVDALNFTKMEEVLDIAYSSNNISCVLDGKATALGYCKLLSTLCNMAGMESHIVLGTWGKLGESAVAMCVVKIGEESIYVDTSGMKAGELAGQRFLTETEAKNHLQMVSYFKY